MIWVNDSGTDSRRATSTHSSTIPRFRSLGLIVYSVPPKSAVAGLPNLTLINSGMASHGTLHIPRPKEVSILAPGICITGLSTVLGGNVSFLKRTVLYNAVAATGGI